jgi:GNAT superfamily N-acetyltransferase
MTGSGRSPGRPDRTGVTLAVETNLWAMHRDFARVPGAEIHEEPGLLWYAVPSTSSWFNGASEIDLPPARADEAIRTVLDRLHPLGRHVTWHVGPSTRPTDFDDRLAAAGFQPPSQGAAGMFVELSAVTRPQQPHGMVVTPARSEDELVVWLDTFLAAFGREPRGRNHPWFTPFAHLGFDPDGPCVLLVGRVDGQSVSTSLGFVGGGAVGIYGVGTVPDARGRGYGSAVTLATMDWGAAKGADLAILHATELGEPVYRRLGFEKVCEISQWLAKAPT